MAQWLVIVSWAAVILGLLTAIVIAIDVLAHRQRMTIMNFVWPITGLYLPLIGWWPYIVIGRPMSVAAHSTAGGHRFWERVFVSTTHCASGCVIGDIIGAPIVFAAGWTLFGERLYADYVVLFALAYVFGIAFQYFPIRAMRKVSPRVAIIDAVKADTLALTAFEIGLFAWMAVVYFLFASRAEPTSVYYWFMMQIGMVLGFVTALPPNWLLVRSGVKGGM
jgi:Domain of unknown function (DUF4396)